MAIINITPQDGIWSAATQAKVRQSQPGDILKFTGTFELQDQFQLLGGATEIDLREAVINVRPGQGKTAGFLLRNQPENPVRVRGGTFNYDPQAGSNPATAVLYVIDCASVSIVGVRLNGLVGIHGIAVESRTFNTKGLRLQGNTIRFKDESYKTSHHVAVRIQSTLAFAPGTNTQNASTKAGYVARPEPLKRIENVRILENDIQGGYYGLGLSGVMYGEIRGNIVRENERGLSIQDTSADLSITWNHIENNRSAGIHLAYGTHGCIVEYNLVRGNKSNGEALMQAYVGTDRNVFRFNAVQSSLSPTHAFQGALGGSLLIENCTARVTTVAKALVASERSWDPSLAQVWHSRSNAPAQASGLEQPLLSNSVRVHNSTLVSDSPNTMYGIVTDVLQRGDGRTFLITDDTQISTPGDTALVKVAPTLSRVEGAVESPETFGNLPVPVFDVSKRVNNRFSSGSDRLQRQWGFAADNGQPPTPPPPPPAPPGGGTPNPPTPTPPSDSGPPTDLSGTLLDGTRTKQLVVFITRPEQSNQYGDWLAFLEVENGEIVTWPESVQIPHWTGKRGFPAVVLPRNGRIGSDFKYLIRTYVELDGTDYLATHPTIRGVQWYNRGDGFSIANPRTTRLKTASGEVPVDIVESPVNQQGSVGEVAPSGYATFVWVQEVGNPNSKVQFVSVRDGVPVPNPDHDGFRNSITYTGTRGFPAIVWPGNRLPSDGNFRNLARTFVTMPASSSGKTDQQTIATTAIANPNKAQVLVNGRRQDLLDSGVHSWFSAGQAPAEEPPTHGEGAGIITSAQELFTNAFKNMSIGHEVEYRGWTAPEAGTSPNRGAQVRGAAITMGGTLIANDLDKSKDYWTSGFDGGFTPEQMRQIASRPTDTLCLWGCVIAGPGGENGQIDIRNVRLYMLPKGAKHWESVLNRNMPPATWVALQGPSMNPHSREEAGWRSRQNHRPNVRNMGAGWVRVDGPATRQQNNHYGPEDWALHGPNMRYKKDFDYGNIEGIMGVVEARVAPGSEGKIMGLQLGFDPKWWGVNPGYWPGIMLSRMIRVPDDWGTLAIVNVNTAGDSNRGNIVLSQSRIRECTVEGFS